jgi:hypothetical protein
VRPAVSSHPLEENGRKCVPCSFALRLAGRLFRPRKGKLVIWF